MNIYESHQTPSVQSLLSTKIGLILSVGFTGLLLVRFALKLSAVSASDFTTLVFKITDIIVKPFTALITPLTFSTGAVVEISSLLPAVVLVIISVMFLWRLYLDRSEPLHVQCVHATST